ncbi:MAG: hypothetical protein ACRDLO_12710 [Solirubrobacterales bacterium]
MPIAQVSDVLFPWIESGGFEANWAEGLGFAGLGIVGALVTIYLFLGGFLPSMGGKAEYEATRLEIEDLAKRRDKQITLREQHTRGDAGIPAERLAEADKLTDDLGEMIEAKEARAAKLRRELIAVGFPLYVLLGGVFAVLFASNALQAILVGFGWTAVADRIGLKRELDEKSRQREEEINKLTERAETAETLRQELTTTQEALKKTTQELASAVTRTATGPPQERGSGDTRAPRQRAPRPASQGKRKR